MKKILVSVLVLVMCITAFVACNPTDDTTPDLSGLNSAKAYLQNQYRDEATNTLGDFVRLATLKVGTATFTVEWTASVTSGPQTITIVDNEDGTVTIDIEEVDETVMEDTLYTLTATITDANGNTTTLTYNHMIPKFAVNTFAEYVAAEAGESIVIDGIVTGILPKGNGATNDGFYMNTLDGGGVYVYQTSGAELTVGQTIRVKGTKDIYSGTHELKNSTYEVLDANVTTVTPVDYTEIFTNAENVKDKALVEKQALLVTIKGVTIGTVGGSDGSYYYFELAGKSTYIRISGSSCPMTTAEQTAFIAAFKANFGATADVTGLITIYDGAFYLTPVSANAISNIAAPELTDQQVVDGAKEALTIVDTIKAAGTVELPTAGTGVYSDATFTWALAETTLAALEGNVLTVAQLPAEAGTITLTATITSGEATDTKDFTVTIKALVVDDPNTIILDLDSLGITGGYGNDTATIENIGFEFIELGTYGNGIQWRQKDGKISTLWNTDALAKAIESIVIVLNPDKSVYDNADVFSFKFGTAADSLSAEVKLSTVADQYEYTITPDAETYTYFSMKKILADFTFYVDSITINYVCEHSYDDDCDETCNLCGDERVVSHVDTDPADCVCDLCEAELDHTDENTDYVCDVCSEDLCAHQFDNNCDNECNICGAANPNYADHVDTTPADCVCDECQATLDHTYDNACDAQCNVCNATREVGEHQYSHVGDKSCNECGDTSRVVAAPVNNVTGADLSTIPALIELGGSQNHNTYTADKYLVVGYVDEVSNTTFGNMNIVDENGNKLAIYGTYNNDGSARYDAMTTKPVAGDVVVIYGVVGRFYETVQIKNGWIMQINDTVLGNVHVCTEFTEATCTEAAQCVVCGKANGEALGHTDEADSNGKCDRCDTEMGALPAATFTFGENGEATHVDGSGLGTSTSYTDGDYTLELTEMSKVYGPAYDATGKSCIKLGTSSAVGTFQFAVDANVSKVVIYVAGYKGNDGKVTVNGTEYSISTLSNNGEYTAIEIDTTTVKTITFATVSGKARCMVDAIEYYA